MMAVRLSAAERADLLAAHPRWRLLTDRDAIARSFEFASASQAVAFLQRVCMAAEAFAHYPEWSGYRGAMTIILTTPAVGGLSEADYELPTIIDGMAERSYAPLAR